MSHRQFGPAGRGSEPRNIQAHRALNAHFEEEEQCRVVLRAKGEGGSSRGMQVFADCSGSGATSAGGLSDSPFRLLHTVEGLTGSLRWQLSPSPIMLGGTELGCGCSEEAFGAAPARVDGSLAEFPSPY